jgi:hypothetical protein
MSTIALGYPNSTQVRRSTNSRWIIILIAGLALVASVILVAVSASAKVDSSSGIVAVPVPVAPVAPSTGSQLLPVETATPALGPNVIAVPVPEPPAP